MDDSDEAEWESYESNGTMFEIRHLTPRELELFCMGKYEQIEGPFVREAETDKEGE